MLIGGKGAWNERFRSGPCDPVTECKSITKRTHLVALLGCWPDLCLFARATRRQVTIWAQSQVTRRSLLATMTTERSPAQDELLAQLLALGFDLPRCQQAISRGFNSVDEAAAFILDIESGAMQVDPHDLHRGPVLALNPLRSTDSTPPRFPDQSTTSSDPSPELKSRYKESRADYFDLAAKKELELAIKRKANDKDSKRRVLEQIREDREKQRLKRAAERGELPEPPQVQQSTSAQPASTKSATTAQPPSSFENTTATIQIRLPSGRALRTRLPASTKLGLIFEYVASETSAPGTLHVDRVAGAAKTGRGLLLAFPKRLFAEESSDADLTIGEAGLAPSASLNLVKAAPPEQPPPPAGGTPSQYTAQTIGL
ncbi:hypothetical protein DFJ73DRAFT_464636 [Zopfochytrium polystomum]|nr:hypothetical protein DFJ73DRAFT_464636 [Zopfochytrium polystomum]